MTKPKAVILYGIKNCTTMNKARAWLDAAAVVYRFHDYKILGIGPQTLEDWVSEIGWETLLNRSGMTFRQLPEKDQKGITGLKALALMRSQPSIIKRPVLDIGGKLIVGFKPEIYQKAFGGGGQAN